VPALWIERQAGSSRFQIFKWMIPYLHWYFYAFATTFLSLKHRPQFKQANAFH
jgi:hypothetical protein